MKRILMGASALALIATGAMAANTSIVIGDQLEPPHLDPTAGAAGAIDNVVYANIYEGLTRFASDGSVIHGLAKSWDISDDGLTYTFTLQNGVKFHDGSDLTASDVLWSLNRARAEDSVNAQKTLFASIADVSAPDDTTVVVTLSAPNGNFLFNMAWGDAVILNEGDDTEALKTKPNGTGAFTFTNWVQGDSITLTRNENYWGEPAKLESATIKYISDPTAAFAAVMAGDVDAFPTFPAPENLAQFDADPRFSVIVGSTEGETILATNNKMPPFDNVKVREALAHAIDRNAIIDGAMFGYGTPIGTHFAPHNPAYLDLTPQSNYDPELARKLLVEAGYPDGFTTTLKLPPPSYARRGGEIIAAQLRAVGIETEVTNLEWGQWLEEVFKGKDFGLTIVSHTEPMDISIYADPDYYFQYGSPAFQTLMEELNTATDVATRFGLMQDAQRMIADDYVNGYLFQLAKTGVANADIRGLWENAPTQATDLTAVYWDH
ncbi:MAG: ABC transporter substrate-binding protein [Rhodobacteraceae bacterium]|nr:ABC transporter substrate-binding protein [Paracoccaceae bacterium]